MRTESYIVCYALIVLAVVAAVAFVGMLAYVIYFYVFRGLLAPVEKTRARAVSKDQREYEVDAPRYIGPMDWHTMIFARIMAALGRDTTFTIYRTWDYFVVFELVDGKKLDLAVPETTYIDIHEGDEGILAHKGGLFRYFLPIRTASRT